MRLAIFDFDGTLADTRLNIVLTMREAMVEFFAAAFHA
jgi:phosphoglycolate phosphatase-like HAD superfamily hydrolase